MILSPTRSETGLLALLRAGPFHPRPDDEPWEAMILRISTPGRVEEIDEAIYDHFLNVLPPHWMGHGFLTAEGVDDLRYFWKWRGRYFCRQMTGDETAQFCEAAGIPVPE